MKTIQRARIDGHKAELALEDGRNVVKILIDDDVVESYDGHTWDNIKDETWAQKGLLAIVAGRLIKRRKLLAEMERIAEEAFK